MFKEKYEKIKDDLESMIEDESLMINQNSPSSINETYLQENGFNVSLIVCNLE